MIHDDKCMMNQSLLFHRVGEGRSNANSRMAQQLRVVYFLFFILRGGSRRVKQKKTSRIRLSVNIN